MQNIGGWRLGPILLALPFLVSGAPVTRGSPAHATVVVAGHATPSHPSDWQSVVTGRLANGLRFAILPRRGSEPGLGLLLRNEGGFIAEARPGERGLAHLIEHLLLVSPTEDAPNEVRHFMRTGLPLTLPAPSAGTTSWRETNYFLSSRTTAAADLDTLLGLFREAAGGLVFRSDLVDEQRADVMREMAERKAANDIYASYIGAVAPGSPNDILDAQNSDDVLSAGIGTIRSLYRRLYRPETMMVVVVGNVNPEQVKALIQKRFGDWEGVGVPAERRPYPRFRSEQVKPVSFSAAPQGRRSALITVVMPTPSASSYRRHQAKAMLMDLLAVQAINNRLARQQPGSPVGKTGIFIENGAEGHRQIMLWDNFAPDGWRPAIAGLKRTTCDLAATGFSDWEWEAAKQNVLQDLEQRALDMPKMANVELAKDLSHALAAGLQLIPPNELLRYARAVFPRIDTPSANAWWRQQWHAGVEHIRIEAPELALANDPLSAIQEAAVEAAGDGPCRLRG